MVNKKDKILLDVGFKEEKKIAPECEKDNLEIIKVKSILKFAVTKKQRGIL